MMATETSQVAVSLSFWVWNELPVATQAAELCCLLQEGSVLPDRLRTSSLETLRLVGQYSFPKQHDDSAKE